MILRKFGYILFCLVFLISTTLSIQAIEFEDIESKYVYVYNFDSDKVLYEKNAHEKMYPASMTKIMTSLVAIEHVTDFDEVIYLDEPVFEGLADAGASVAGYQIGDSASIRDLLYGIMLPSGADASRAIAFKVAGSEANFVKLMNEKAKALQLENTHFVNTSGLHEDEHYTTVSDIAIILKEALKNEMFTKLFTTTTYTTQPTIAYPNGIYLQATTNKMIQRNGLEEGVLEGAKTGFTLEAGLCIASTAIGENARYMVVTGQAGEDVENAQHIRDAYHIYEQLYDTYENKILYKKEENVSKKDVRFAKSKQIDTYAKEDVTAFIEKQNTDVQVSISDEERTAPILQGEEVARMTLSYQGKEIKQIPLYAQTAVERNWFTFSLYWGSIIVAVLAVICLLMVVIRKVQRRNRIMKK